MAQVDKTEISGVTSDKGASAPRFLDWLWHPWYAKVWWGAIALFWSGLFLADAIFRFPRPWTFAADLEWLALLLHPFTVLFVLGLLFVQAWWRNNFWHSDEREQVELQHDGSDGIAFHQPLGDFTDPLDPYWMTNPVNPSSKAWRDKHLH